MNEWDSYWKIVADGIRWGPQRPRLVFHVDRDVYYRVWDGVRAGAWSEVEIALAGSVRSAMEREP